MNNKDCPIIYCLDRKFIEFTKVSLTSLLKHNPGAHIELVVPEYLEELSQYKQHICNSSMLENAYIREYDRISAFTYARLYIPEFLSNYDKCLYIDGDIIIRQNLEELINTDVEFIGAVKDNNPEWLLDGIEKDVYYNAGLLLLNLKALREDNFTKKTLDYITNHETTYLGREGTWLHDQTTINALYSERITELDIKWNDQLSWNPPTEYKHINESGSNLHFLTDYNKSSFVKYLIDRNDYYNHLTEDDISIILTICNETDAFFVNETIQSVLKQNFSKFKLHVFVMSRNKTLDRFFEKFEDDRVTLYDITAFNEDKHALEYAKSKIGNSKYTFIINENTILKKDALTELLIHSIRFNNDVVISRCAMIGDYSEVYDWPRPEEARAQMLFYEYNREGSIFCRTELFKEFNFKQCSVYPVYEFCNWLILQKVKDYGVTFEVNEYYRDRLFDRMRFYYIGEEMTWLVKRSIERFGCSVNFNEARFLNPYYTNHIELTPSEIRNVKCIRRKFEYMNNFDNNILYNNFKV